MLGIKLRGLGTWIDKHATTGPHCLLQGPAWNLRVAALVETAGQLRCSTDSFILITFHTCNISRQWNVTEGLMKKGPIYEWGNFLLCVKGLSWNVDLLLQSCFLVVPPDSSTQNDFYWANLFPLEWRENPTAAVHTEAAKYRAVASSAM